jgi:epoxide hydrolase
VRSPHEGALPLVITHGWPGSVVEFGKVIGPLADPVAHGGDAADAFHVVCPSLPGYGFSGKPARTGWGSGPTADAWDQLMARLGYARYGAQGGDWGAQVTTALGMRHPGHLAGIHLNIPIAFPDRPARASPRRGSRRRWAERQFPDLRYWNEPDRGGHFAAFEQPAAFVEEVRAAFR